jgi:hypothetical protein
MKNSIKTKAVIYFRPEEQKSNLYKKSTDEQLAKCYGYCEKKEYQVAKVFYDNSILPYAFDQKVFNEMLDFIDGQDITKGIVVVFNDLSNFRRDYRELLKIKTSIFHQRGAGIECLNFKFQNTAHGRLVENVLGLLTELSVI